ncbi:MAG: hypothetical protein QM504_18760 [Pseudomonadota bacterium]
MEAWQTILLTLGANTVVLAVLGWLAKSLVSQQLTKDVEMFKSTLKAESEAASQTLRHQLEKASIEHQVRFSKLHEKRAEVIAEIYSLLVQAHWDILSFVSPMEMAGEPEKQEKYVTAMNSVADFYRYFDKQRIYIPENLCDQINEFVREMRSKAIGFGVYVHYNDEALPKHALQKKHDAWIGASEYLEKKVPDAKAALENELRNILGAAS